MTKRNPQKTSWNNVAPWYQKSVGNSGHYYHEHIVIPGALRLLQLKPDSKLLDLACGQGVLARSIPKNTRYFGLDVAPDLIKFAKSNSPANKEFQVQDITREFDLGEKFTHATIILALQNLHKFEPALTNAAKHLEETGKLLIVINHPSFRIPRQSDWGIDDKTKQQYRKVFRYMSPLEIPINMTPGQGKQKLTWSYHHPLSDYATALKNSGFVIEQIEEWCSDKTSVGKAAKAENRARDEFPLFMAILARRTTL